MSRRRSGFTLVELLVATAILGILIAAVIALTSAFLGFSRRVSVVNERLTDLNDVMGYVSLNARRSVRVAGNASPVTITPAGGDPFDCSLAAANPCIALVVPILDEDFEIDGFDLVAYRVAPLSAWTNNPGVAGGWDGASTPALFEYSVNLCSGCTLPSPTIAGTAVTNARETLVMADLFLEDNAGLAIAPFAISGELNRVTVRVRTRGSGLVDDVRVPTDGPLQLQVVRRP